MNNLAELYISTKQIDKAETLLEDLLEYIHDKKLDLSSYTYLMIINNLSCAYHTKIKSVEAINLLESTKLFIEKNIDQSKYNDLLVEYYCISMSNLSVYYKNINIDGYDWCYITTDGITNINSYKTYEEAYEIGLQEALKLI